MAKINQTEIDEIRGEWEPKAEKVEVKLKEIATVCSKDIDKVADACEKFFESAQAIHKVGEQILDMLDEREEPNLTMVKTVHRAIHKAQALSGEMRIVYLPQMTDIENTATTLLNTLYVQFMNSNIVVNTFTTNADKEREASYIVLKCQEYTDIVKTRKKQLDSYLKFVDEQMYGLNRLDSMLKDSVGMLDTEMFSKAGELPDRPDVDNEDAFADDFEDDDNGIEAVKEEAPKKSVRKTRSKPIDDFEDDFEDL